MIIKNITIENFRSYYRENSIDPKIRNYHPIHD